MIFHVIGLISRTAAAVAVEVNEAAKKKNARTNAVIALMSDGHLSILNKRSTYVRYLLIVFLLEKG
jgi:hypothetical protein